MTIAAPASEEEAREIVAAAAEKKVPLAILGGGSRTGFGRPVESQAALSTRALSGIIFYEPHELVVSARAGTPMRELIDALAARGQEFAFEPIDHGPLYGGAPDRGTIGGAVAVNASGPRRLKAGAARDHLLGFRCVTGHGEIVKSGGRVMKNVTGYDLSKLVAGSHGTLALLTEVTLKALPKAEAEETVLAVVSGEAEGLGLLREATRLALDASGFALWPDWAARGPAAAVRIEGMARSVAQRREEWVAQVSGRALQTDVISGDESRRFWAGVRDLEPVRAGDGVVWRASVAPSQGAAVLADLRAVKAPIRATLFDWAGGLLWIALEPTADASAPLVRPLVERRGGHATLMRADDEARRAVPVFHPQPPALARLTGNVKDSFDPFHILNRGRLRADF